MGKGYFEKLFMLILGPQVTGMRHMFKKLEECRYNGLLYLGVPNR